MRYCKCGCGQIIKGHPNKKFVNKRHKDRYWNRENPRGYYKYSNRKLEENDENSSDEYFYATTAFNDPDALGQE